MRRRGFVVDLNKLEYDIINDEVVIWQYLDNQIDELEIPSHIDGKPVVKIERSTFLGFPLLKKVVIPHTVSVIERYAFERCTALEIVKCESPDIELCDGAFLRCSNLRLFASSGNVYIRTAVFKNCIKLESVCGKITGTARHSFANCSRLHNPLVFAEKVDRFHGDAFNNCQNLTDIYVLGDIDVIDAFSPEKLVQICFHCAQTSNILNWAYSGICVCVN